MAFGLPLQTFTPNHAGNMPTRDVASLAGGGGVGGRGQSVKEEGLDEAATSRTAVLMACLCGRRSGSPKLQLLEFLPETPELASTPEDAGLKAGHVRSQLQA